MQYRTRQLDVLDAICQQHYGHTQGVVEIVLSANPGLAEHGTHLPAGLLIDLPEIQRPEQPLVAESVQLWS